MNQALIDILAQVDSMEQYLKVPEDDYLGVVKMIGNDDHFLEWKERLLNELRGEEQIPIIVEIIDLLQDGFTSGWNDEKSFKYMRAKIHVLMERAERSEKEKVAQINQSLKKGMELNTAFENYSIIHLVGEGGNGRVYSAVSSTGEKVAIKFVKRELGNNKFNRFKNEIWFCEKANHKNIIRVLDRGYVHLDDDYSFYVMPLYSQTLRDKIKEGICADDIISIFSGILDGLEYAHGQATIHRDIKPENILFAENSNEPVISDFGIAHFAEEQMIASVKTKRNDRMCNFQYCAPEQKMRGREILPQTDIYAAALILNEMFTGEIPLASGHKTIASVNSRFSYLDEIVEKILKQDPKERMYPEQAIREKIRASMPCGK